MTADRLRQAADALEPEWMATTQSKATAALLRTVADEGPYTMESLTPDLGLRYLPHPTYTAALALADVILGGAA